MSLGGHIARYRQLPRAIWLLVVGQFMLNVVNSAFVLILNIFLRKQGYTDSAIANFTSYRFMAVLLFAFPLGLFIRGRRLKPYFVISATMLPCVSLLVLEACRLQCARCAAAGFLLWGVTLMFFQVCATPFIMRHAPKALQAESLSLTFSSWPLAMLFAGLIINLLSSLGTGAIGPVSFAWDELHILRAIIVAGIVSAPVLLSIREPTPTTPRLTVTQVTHSLRYEYDWNLLLRVLAPMVIIAVGAGLTVPFINLFFNTVFHIDSARFSLMGSGSAILVFIALLSTPALKRRGGYRLTILLTQALSIAVLITMALTEYAAHVRGIVCLAAACYMFRQPLMNMAMPMTSQLAMNYVGKRNQELMSALSSSVWSGSWFLSAKLFQTCRDRNLRYATIFLITAALYTAGVVCWYVVIRDHEKRMGL